MFLIDAPTLILFVDYLGTGAQGAIKLKNSSNVDVTDLDPQDHIEFYDNQVYATWLSSTRPVVSRLGNADPTPTEFHYELYMGAAS